MSSLSWMHLAIARRYPHSFTCLTVAASSFPRAHTHTHTHRHGHAYASAAEQPSWWCSVYFSFCRDVSWLAHSIAFIWYEGARRESKDHPHSTWHHFANVNDWHRPSAVGSVAVPWFIHMHTHSILMLGPLLRFLIFIFFGAQREMDMHLISWFIDGIKRTQGAEH